MKKIFLFLFLVTLTINVFGQKTSFQKDQKNFSNEAVKTMQHLQKTSPLLLNAERLFLLNKFQSYSDKLLDTTFKSYLLSTDQESANIEHTTPILYCYRNSFDKVISEVRDTKVKKGTAMVWLLYNMGFVIKTPSGCFGIDIDHRYAEQLEPYLDFLCITHNHGDHANVKLIEAMNKKGKPILSNFYENSKQYFSKVPTTYNIGDFTIHTAITGHLSNAQLPDFVTLFRVECGKNAGGFSVLHCGDSSFNPKHLTNVQGPVSMAILRWGAPVENNILGIGEGQVKTDYAVLSHLIELRHKPYPHGQASITKTLEHLPNVDCDNTILPFWGEKLIWKNGKLN